jgi:uncharacterized short protein YbdD (DUF466 family)
MICKTCAPSLHSLASRLRETASLMVGIPDYDVYLAHHAANHPGQTPMTRGEFVSNRTQARYGDGPGRGFRCC